ncbi:hypothetical protein Dda_1076 [Drechslerella dactyloides]|uniref:RBR-type E3 ubiquitin transferase n=1 Tax=Drechslerella dactyloides TaxID=74499 RepID=A0AAD6NPH1_DREDA|nr:hypothetical protein Dda_1076 [Drechslerella dactyloides]
MTIVAVDIDTPLDLSAAISAQMYEITASSAYDRSHPDFQFAVRLMEEELRGLEQIEADARVARRIEQGEEINTPRVADTVPRIFARTDDERIESDLHLAERLARGENIPSSYGLPAHGTSSDENYKAGSLAKTKSPKKSNASGKRAQHTRGSHSGNGPTAPQTKASRSPLHKVQVSRKRVKPAAPPKPRPKPAATPSECAPKHNLEEEISQLQDLLQVLAISADWTFNWQDDEPTTSAQAASKLYKEELSAICNICGDMHQNYRVFSLDCGHRYCVDCLRDHIMHVVNRKSQYPPRCCEPLPLVFAAEVLMETELNRLLDLRDAHESSKQVSCHDCKEDILQGSIQDSSAYCVSCAKFTCTHCGKELHDGLCPEDKDTAMLLETARNEGWSKCEKCSHVVELTVGCFHMTCRCGHSFCYLCGVSWKTCDCPSSSENSVLGRIREATGKGAELLKQRWATSRIYKLDLHQLDQFKTQAISSHRKKMDLRQSLHEVRVDKQDMRQIAEQIILLRSEIADLQGNIDRAGERRRRKKEKEVAEGLAVGEAIVAKGLKAAEKKGKKGKKPVKPSKKGKERAKNVGVANTGEIVTKIMDYAKER